MFSCFQGDIHTHTAHDLFVPTKDLTVETRPPSHHLSFRCAYNGHGLLANTVIGVFLVSAVIECYWLGNGSMVTMDMSAVLVSTGIR
ncbi:hypothetical protein P171DRAFT_434166 [Karstenula rhodostoma CBS 690.94]|uniref:Uncharacterized protein n=1 Tax=Karstenula rhodostoma CBS 690.94 TaxID=1392251 RepID=A0A9P4U8S1_9PLEO|nr:hypothetical protein P171DRAFT_434166 [Karstenula rhodostoma CBS 690.94]